MTSAVCATGYHHACGLSGCGCDCHPPVRCPRCQGRLYSEEDAQACFMCGWRPTRSHMEPDDEDPRVGHRVKAVAL